MEKWRRHAVLRLAESLDALELEQVRRAKVAADIGSGAGFPGLALAAALPDTRVTLIEQNQRRCRFLEECVEAMALANVEVVQAPVQMWTGGDSRFDLVTSRGLMHAPVMFRLAAPLLKDGGALVLWAHDHEKDGVEDEARTAALRLSLAPVAIMGEERPLSPCLHKDGKFLGCGRRKQTASATVDSLADRGQEERSVCCARTVERSRASYASAKLGLTRSRNGSPRSERRKPAHRTNNVHKSIPRSSGSRRIELPWPNSSSSRSLFSRRGPRKRTAPACWPHTNARTSTAPTDNSRRLLAEAPPSARRSPIGARSDASERTGWLRWSSRVCSRPIRGRKSPQKRLHSHARQKRDSLRSSNGRENFGHVGSFVGGRSGGVRLPFEDRWLQIALSPRLLDVANAYLGMWAKLHRLQPGVQGCAARGCRALGEIASRRTRQTPREG